MGSLPLQAVPGLPPRDDGAFAAPSVCPDGHATGPAATAHCGSLTATPPGVGACEEDGGQRPHHRPTLQGLLRSCVFGFSGRGMEARYVSYVTRSNAYVTLLWCVFMVMAHAAAGFKSLSTGDAGQVGTCTRLQGVNSMQLPLHIAVGQGFCRLHCGPVLHTAASPLQPSLARAFRRNGNR